jgi:hypothetical protein
MLPLINEEKNKELIVIKAIAKNNWYDTEDIAKA